ncbi:hypothetical protein F5Y07DRAFT_153468 [Xylaria sp. FL0933]|nr:hypothetical protein F5Y07DRAFT_153468 [Xylaria sp. FL0933]
MFGDSRAMQDGHLLAADRGVYATTTHAKFKHTNQQASIVFAHHIPLRKSALLVNWKTMRLIHATRSGILYTPWLSRSPGSSDPPPMLPFHFLLVLTPIPVFSPVFIAPCSVYLFCFSYYYFCQFLVLLTRASGGLESFTLSQFSHVFNAGVPGRPFQM